jgi:choline dehydrogenase-like flavoprotein
MATPYDIALIGSGTGGGTLARALAPTSEKILLAGVAHQNGTIRFGRDPRDSALDVHCKAHDLDHLKERLR